MSFPQSGDIWNLPARQRAQTVRRVCEAFERVYGRPRFGNPRNPIDDLVYIVLSNKTGPDIAAETFKHLKHIFGNWNALVDARLSKVRRVLRPAGLSDVKARQLRGALRQIRRDFGKCSLNRLKRISCQQAESYLTSLQGVSEKVAKCVMMYTLDFDVLPVDAHVHRIATRLGWTARKRADQCHSELEALVKPRYRFAFHVGCIAHGRAICRPVDPLCEDCIVRHHCVYYQARLNERQQPTD